MEPDGVAKRTLIPLQVHRAAKRKRGMRDGEVTTTVAIAINRPIMRVKEMEGKIERERECGNASMLSTLQDDKRLLPLQLVKTATNQSAGKEGAFRLYPTPKKRSRERERERDRERKRESAAQTPA